MILADLSVDKLDALEWMQAFLEGDRPGYRVMCGEAGSGKTTALVHLYERIIETAQVNVAFTAVTGKAAAVLDSKGVPARTLCSLISSPRKQSDGRVVQLPRRHLRDVQGIVVDESSMVDHVTMQDTLRYGLPVLFVGDPYQLPPIGTDPHLFDKPDFVLNQVFRQQATSPILSFARELRERKPPSKYASPDGRLQIVGRDEFWKLVSPAFQILCGENRTRRAVNDRVRKHLGLAGAKVAPGDRLVCLKNNKRWGLFNGQDVTVLEVDRERSGIIEIEIQPEREAPFVVPCLVDQFGRDELVPNPKPTRFAHFDYGFALTVHRAQGSEFDSVLVLDEVVGIPHRWRYTAATRAKDRLIYCT